MSLFRMETHQKLPVTIREAWDFLSSPENLKKITPPEMAFTIRTGFKPEEKMYAGMIISYTVKPLLGIPMNWVTEITHVQEPKYFVDEQRFGPYSMWHHKHFLKEIDGGVEMHDVIDYKLPFGLLGDLMNRIIVKDKLSAIFKFRYKRLEIIFGKWKETNI